MSALGRERPAFQKTLRRLGIDVQAARDAAKKP